MVVRVSNPLTSSIPSYLDRKDDWDRCIAKAMGFEWIGDDEELIAATPNVPSDPRMMSMQLLNLLLSENDDSEEEVDNRHEEDQINSGDTNHIGCDNHSNTIRISHGQDMWMESAERIRMDIDQMATWIRQSLQYSMARVDLPLEEASLLNSTITSYCASTANEIETLRKLTQHNLLQAEQQQITKSTGKKEKAGREDTGAVVTSSALISQQSLLHRSGIVQILLGKLQEQVVEPFAKLQQQRRRKAVELWQSPLQCRLRSVSGRHRRDDDEDIITLSDERFLPSSVSPPQRELYDVLLKYKDTEPTLDVSVAGKSHNSDPPVSRLFHTNSHAKNQEKVKSSSGTAKTSNSAAAAVTPVTAKTMRNEKIPRPQKSSDDQVSSYLAKPDPDDNQQNDSDLQREATMLLAQLEHSELDTVQQMEERMVEITTLLTQFAGLLTEQQEDIIQIHQATVSSQEDLVKGKESLVDATERTKKSKHYMATFIFILGLILMLWNALRP